MVVEVTEVWLVRHGETGANAARVIQGHTDEPLNDVGESQARRLSAWLAGAGRPSFDAAVASPLVRARRTAEIALAPLALAIAEDARWMERGFGEWEGRRAEEVYAEHDAGAGQTPFDVKPPGGESIQDMASRVFAGFDDWVARDDIGERLVVVTHGGPIGALVCRALGMTYNAENNRRFARDNTGVTILRRKRHGPGAFLVDTLNTRFHLDTP